MDALPESYEMEPLPTTEVKPGKTPPTRANTYAAKKTVAQGMMDIALITANANQLRFIIEYSSGTNTFYLVLLLIIISLALQVQAAPRGPAGCGAPGGCPARPYLDPPLNKSFNNLPSVAVGVSLIFKGKFDLGGESKLEHANRINNYVVVGVFLITIINVFIAAFSIRGDKV